MAFPTVESSLTAAQAVASGSHSVTVPSGVQDEDLLISVCQFNPPGGSVEVTAPSGWTVVARVPDPGFGLMAVAMRAADGTESGGVVDWGSDVDCTSAAVTSRVSGVDVASSSLLSWGVGRTGAGSTPESYVVRSNVGVEDNLFLAFVGAVDDDETVVSGPSGFAVNGSAVSGGGTNNGCTVGMASSASAVGFVEPSAWGLSGSEAWVTICVCVSPAVGVVDPNPNQVDSNLKVCWDLDDDGDFSEPEEDITRYVLSGESVYGRDNSSQLLGQASPGKLRLSLNSDGGRFGFFNTNSPLNQPPFRVKSGGRIRVETKNAFGSDPTVLAKDGFNTDGTPANDETGLAWQGVGVAVKENGVLKSPNISAPYVNITESNFVASCQISDCEPHNSGQVGLTYGFDSGDGSFAAFYVDHYNDAGSSYLFPYVSGIYHGQFTWDGTNLVEVGTHSLVYEMDATRYRHLQIEILGGTAVVYLDSVWKAEVPTLATTGGGVGLLIDNPNDRSYEVDDFVVYDKIPAPRSGVIWSGRVESCQPSTSGHGVETAQLQAIGALSIPARTEMDQLESLGVQPEVSVGISSGELVGNSLLRSGIGPLAHIDTSVTLGAVEPVSGKALSFARAAEQTELGRLYETPEGNVGFSSFSPPVDSFVRSRWTDGVGVFSPEGIDIDDWRDNKRNRVKSFVSPKCPKLLDWRAFKQSSGAVSQIDYTQLPAEAAAGDLVVVAFWCTNVRETEDWLEPAGWKNITGDARGQVGKFRVFGRILEEEDLVATGNVVFYANSPNVAGTTLGYLYLIQDFFGSLSEGISVAESGFSGDVMEAAAQNGTLSLPAVATPWGGKPSLHIRAIAGANAESLGSYTATSPSAHERPYKCRAGFFIEDFAATSNRRKLAMVDSYRYTAEDRLDKNGFSHDHGGFDNLSTIDIMVRGFTGAGLDRAKLPVVSDNFDSQAQTGGVLSYELPGALFSSVEDAENFNALVLNKYATENPTLKMSFTASKSGSHMTEAVERRVGDKIYLDLSGQSNIGILGVYVIESISHRWSSGDSLWVTSWGIAPLG